MQDDQAEVIDEEELQRLRELKQLKKQYRDSYKELKELQKETKFTQQAIDNQKQKLIAEFEEWYNETFEEESNQQTTSSMQGSNMQAAQRSVATKGTPGKFVRNDEMYEDEDEAEADRKQQEDDGNEGVDVDPDAMAYIRSRKAVQKLSAARKNQ